jgi:hypothetical protein
MTMTPFWIVNSILYGALFFSALPGAWAAVTGRETRLGDPVRLFILSVAVMMAGFSLRWLVAPANEPAWQALYLLSAVNAVYGFIILCSYGRGPHV